MPVAPLAGAWIETMMDQILDEKEKVAPLAGAWIETKERAENKGVDIGRSPRGSVD